MTMKLKVTALAVVIVIIGAWYTWRTVGIDSSLNMSQEGKAMASRSVIDPRDFSKEEALSALTLLEAKSNLFLEVRSAEMSFVNVLDLPTELAPLLTEENGEILWAGKGSVAGKDYYRVYYSSNMAMPENYTYLIRLSGRSGLKFINGYRNQLASLFEAESSEFLVRVSQIVVSESQTEVVFHALEK